MEEINNDNPVPHESLTSCHWSRVKEARDILEVYEYIENNAESPFIEEARELLRELKETEVKGMLESPECYDVLRLFSLLESGIFTEDELIGRGCLTRCVLKHVLDYYQNRFSPEVNSEIFDSCTEYREGATDVYFFGLPKSGITLMLGSLLYSDLVSVDLYGANGRYVRTLFRHLDACCTMPNSPIYLKTIAMDCLDAAGNVAHEFNLVEMSSFGFIDRMVDGAGSNFSFVEFGNSVDELLRNDNRKVFFIIVDPVRDMFRFSHEKVKYDEETGEKRMSLERGVMNQRTLLQKFVNLFQNPSNAEIMRKVDAIHFIMTKADTLGTISEREKNACELFMEKYSSLLLPLDVLCKKYRINANNKYHPKLFTFSIGQFYVGGFYEHDMTDSDRLAKFLTESVAEPDNGLWDKVMNSFKLFRNK